MNVASQPKLQIIRDWINNGALELRDAGIESAQLDAEIILAHTIKKPRTWLHAHDDEWLEPRQREIADARLALRVDRTPLAYIIGHKEFYGRRFTVSPAVLIPRPESEAIIDSLKKYSISNHRRLVDVGTGSGILAITAKLELPDLTVIACDIDQHALNVANRNATVHDTDVTFQKSNLLAGFSGDIDIIIANLPYVDTSWGVEKELSYEPSISLYAKQHGLDLIYQLIPQASRFLSSAGLLILEADARQHDEITTMCQKYHFTLLGIDGLALSFARD